jgi:hypothetical protein
MGHNWKFVSGDWWILCDSCNKKIQASKAKHRWDGFIVCSDCFETRHPQDFIRTRADKISVPFSRPRSTDTYVVTDDVFYWDNRYTKSGYIDGDDI